LQEETKNKELLAEGDLINYDGHRWVPSSLPRDNFEPIKIKYALDLSMTKFNSPLNNPVIPLLFHIFHLYIEI